MAASKPVTIGGKGAEIETVGEDNPGPETTLSSCTSNKRKLEDNLSEVDENDENRSFWIESVKNFERDEKLQNKVSIFRIIWLERGNSRGWDASVAEELDKVCFKIKCLARETKILVEQQRAANHVLASAISAMKVS
ncbi:hypothetical protein RJ640_005740, partial [Escallonia rubra]